MIISFADKITADIYHGVDSRYTRKIPENLHAKICRLLDQLNAVTEVKTLLIPPSNHLEKLEGDLKGYWSIRVNIKWRIIFKWENNNVHNAKIIDYH